MTGSLPQRSRRPVTALFAAEDDRPKNGQISARRTLDGKPYYEISAAASQGMSGGPLVDVDGRVLGLVTAAPDGETQSFNLATASTSALALLRDTGSPRAERERPELHRGPHGLLRRRLRRGGGVLRRGARGGPGLLVILIAVCGGIAVLSAAAATILLARRRRADRDLPTPPMGIPMPATGTPEDRTP